MDDAAEHLYGWIERWLASYPIEHRLALNIDGVGMRLGVNDTALADILAEYFSEFVIEKLPEGPCVDLVLLETGELLQLDLPFKPQDPGPGKTRIKDEYVDFADGRLLRKRQTGMLFAYGASPHMAIGPCIREYNQAVNFINNRFMQVRMDAGWLLYHAAGICKDGKGMMLAGTPGRGKSTLALHLVRQGLDFVSNDRLLAAGKADEMVMLGIPKRPRINPGTIINNAALASIPEAEDLARYQAMPKSELWDLEEKYDADIRALFGDGRVHLRANLRAALVLNWRNDVDEPAAFERVDVGRRPELLAALRKEPGVHYLVPAGEPTDFSPGAYVRQLVDLPVYEARGGVDFDAACQFCREVIA